MVVLKRGESAWIQEFLFVFSRCILKADLAGFVGGLGRRSRREKEKSGINMMESNHILGT